MSDVGAGAGAVDQEEKVMADSGVAATVSVSLHPLVIMNISEHWTRSVLILSLLLDPKLPAINWNYFND